MELLVPISWALLALVHVAPAAALFSPALLLRLYGVEPEDDVGVLLTHRAALFLAIVVLAVSALLDPGARRAASLGVAVSVVGFLAVYGRAGMARGPLRKIALADAAALAPLAVVLLDAWRSR